MELNEREAHCIARIIQSALFAGEQGLYTGCDYCRYQCDKQASVFFELKKRLTEATGVDLSMSASGGHLLNSEFPYFKFLHAANPQIKEYFRDRFSHVCEDTWR